MTRRLEGSDAPFVVATDYMKSYAEQLRALCPAPFYALGADGFGRSDTRQQLRRFFEVSREYVVLAALKSLADAGSLAPEKVVEARDKLGIDPGKPDPTTV
jgi:pyruvate dehydrogenase E1 component